MPFIFEDGTGIAGANSYASIAEADAIEDASLNGDAWFEADDLKKQRALMTASRMLDDMWRWNGTSATTTQGLDWPLKGTLPGSLFFPHDIKRATADLALWLIKNPVGASGTQTAVQTVEGVKLGPMELTFAVPADQEASVAEVFPSSVARFLRQYGTMGSGGNVMRLRR